MCLLVLYLEVGREMAPINNPAESSNSTHIVLLYLSLLGHTNSHLSVGHCGPCCRLMVAKTVITLQVSNLVKQT